LRKPLEQRGSIGAKATPMPRGSARRLPNEKLANGECDGYTPADQEREDRRNERPQKSCAAVAQGVLGIRGTARIAQGESEQQLV